MIRRTTQLAPLMVPTAVLLGSFALDEPDGLHGLIRTARAGDQGAMLEVRSRIRTVIADVWPEIMDATLVPVPRHVPGPAHALVMAACDEIADARNWRVAAGALRRIEPAPEGKAGGERDVETEFRTLAWVGTTPGDVIVLVDDVVRSGATMQTCARALRTSGDERRLLAIALAQAEIPERAT